MHTDATRAIIELSGEDRSYFLQGIITQDINLLREDRGLFAAILSPQGKILNDFFLIPHGDTVLLDCDRAQRDALLKRLTMYKLRAKVVLRDVSAEWHAAYRPRAEHAAVGHVSHKKHLLVMTDPRAAELGERLYIENESIVPKGTMSVDEYHRHRMRLGVPDGAHDIMEDVAMDAGYDALGAISFTKGCYVGQEVTARMHYKNIARRGFYLIEADAELPHAGSTVTAAGVPIGTLRGSIGQCALAMLKFEEAETARTNGTPILVDNIALRVSTPAWLHGKLAQFRAARENQ